MKPCPYCGNNPVPHRLYWQQESLNILFTPVRQDLLYNRFTRFLKRKSRGEKLALFLLNLGEQLKIITRQKDIAKCKVRRAQVLWEQAEKRGIEMSELLLFGRPFDCYVAENRRIRESENQKSESKIVFSGLPRPAGYVNHRLDLIDDKWLFKKMMMENGLPVPMGASCSGFSHAKRIFEQIQERNNHADGIATSDSPIFPILRHSAIVKPRAGSRGRHTTTFVSSEQDLKRAFKIAKQLCYWVMVEEQLFGPVYRATLVNFELCGVLRGDPPQITGDGIKSIGDLVQQKNRMRHLGVKDIIVDKSMERFLERELNFKFQISNFKPGRQTSVFDYIPGKDELVILSEKIGVNYGGSSSEDFEICHPDNKELFVAAAKVLGDPLVGFDFIIPDISKPWQSQKCGFIEVNSLPFINLHHDPLHGNPRNVAAKVWEMVGW